MELCSPDLQESPFLPVCLAVLPRASALGTIWGLSHLSLKLWGTAMSEVLLQAALARKPLIAPRPAARGRRQPPAPARGRERGWGWGPAELSPTGLQAGEGSAGPRPHPRPRRLLLRAPRPGAP